VRVLAATCDEAHRHGALAGIELSHTGAHGETSESRLAASAPSQIASDFAPGLVPRAMSKRDIRRVQADWTRAARQSRTAGFDIVYVYGAHTYLPGQFLSPDYNRRSDEYGGSLENRARFWLETLEAVRTAVGDDCAIACRVAVDRMGALGVDIEEGLEFVRMADHLVDLWDVTVGSIAEWSKDSGPSRFFAEGWQLRQHRARARGDDQANRGRQPPDGPRPDGRDRAQRRLGPDRSRPSLDCRSIPAEQDRRGARR
jgi:dimethylamine/trimethylamine dehydrogenase